MINKLVLDQSTYPSYNVDADNSISNLSKLNIFIGQNNSGKSRFLRTLFVDDRFEFELKKSEFAKIRAFLGFKFQELSKLFHDFHILDADGILVKLEELAKSSRNFKLGQVKDEIQKIRVFAKECEGRKDFGGFTYKPNFSTTSENLHLIQPINELGSDLLKLISEHFTDDFDFNFERIYIPILRGLRPIQSVGEGQFSEQHDNYKERTVRDYFKGGRKSIESEIFTGLNLYEDTKKLLLGNKEGRERIKKFEEFLSRNFFENMQVTLIPDIGNDVLLIGIGKEERPVYELGDGIQAIIILLYPLFFNQNKNLLVFIEEPENSMHPGLQRVFVETLMKEEEFKNVQFFITTHSNHFLDITLDIESISIYTFRKSVSRNSQPDRFLIENVGNEDIRTLDLIGARNSSVFLSNCTIWVEGITDRLYLKKYLELFQKEMISKGEIECAFKEDFHFSFVEYGGGNIVHWSFSDEDSWGKIRSSRLSSKIFVIVDSDNTSSKPNSAKAKRHLQLKENLKNNFRIIDGREIENTLSETTLIKTVLSLVKDKAVVKYDEKKMKIAKYKNEYMGAFIDRNFINTGKKFSADSGTIAEKVPFCKKAISLMNTYDELSQEGKELASEVFNFVKSSNLLGSDEASA